MPADIRHLDLNLLRTLDVLLDERNVTRAAKRLALTQPAVSGMLTRLRESFDDPLFVRTQRGIVPTRRAQAPVKQLLGDVETLLKPPAFDPATTCATLTLAATDYALRTVVVPLMAMLRHQAPGIRRSYLAVVAVDNHRLQTQFEQGDVDLALVTPETTPPGLHARPLYQESYVCVMRADHPDAANGRLCSGQLILATALDCM